MNKNSAVDISVIIPVFNGERFLATAIENVLCQGMSSLEIIVVDDGSKDNTSEIAAKFSKHVRYYYQDNQGPSAARNRGLLQAKGNFIAFLDCDDCWTENNLKVLHQAHLDFPEADIIMGKIQEETFDKQSNAFKKKGGPIFTLSLVTILAKKSAVNKIGFFNESLRIGEDKDWFYRAREQQINLKLLENHVSLHHRRHDANLTNNMAHSETYLLKLLRMSIERKKLNKEQMQ
jgi:glycosyltransferase involved in cell wall biosynthesis